MTEERITLQVEGPSIGETYPLHDLIAILDGLHSAIDRSFLESVGKKRLTREDRLSYRILASGSKVGSYHQELEIVYKTASTLMLFTSNLSASDIWRFTKEAFDLLKTVAELRRNGKQPTVSAPNNQGILAIGAPGSGPIHVSQKVFNVALSSEDVYKKLTAPIGKGQIEVIKALDRDRTGIVLTEAERQLFNPDTRVEDSPVTVSGLVFDFNTEKRAGKIRIPEGQSLPARDYNFVLVGKQDQIPYILAMTKEHAVLRCLPEIELHPTGARTIARLHAMSIQVEGR